MKKQLLGMAIAAALGVSSNAYALDVDLFEEFQFVEDAVLGGGGDEDFVMESAPGNILGMERDISVEFLNGSDTPNNGVTMEVFDGVLSFSNDNNVGGEGIVQWDGVDGSMNLDTDGLGGIDLKAFGNGFVVETLTADLGFPIFINAYTDDDTFTLVEIATTGPGVEFVSFAALENTFLCGGSFGPILSVTCGDDGNVDMSNFGALEFIINADGGTTAVDLSIGPIKVPEPAVISLLGAGLIGAAAIRRRRSKEKKA